LTSRGAVQVLNECIGSDRVGEEAAGDGAGDGATAGDERHPVGGSALVLGVVDVQRVQARDGVRVEHARRGARREAGVVATVRVVETRVHVAQSTCDTKWRKW